MTDAAVQQRRTPSSIQKIEELAFRGGITAHLGIIFEAEKRDLKRGQEKNAVQPQPPWIIIGSGEIALRST